jgi:hypothetical protein
LEINVCLPLFSFPEPHILVKSIIFIPTWHPALTFTLQPQFLQALLILCPRLNGISAQHHLFCQSLSNDLLVDLLVVSSKSGQQDCWSYIFENASFLLLNLVCELADQSACLASVTP